MGMYDSFYIDGRVFKSKEFNIEDEWQTKSLDCQLDKYFIDEFGSVMCNNSSFFIVNNIATEELLTFKASIYLYFDDNRELYYTIEVKNSKLVSYVRKNKIEYFQ